MKTNLITTIPGKMRGYVNWTMAATLLLLLATAGAVRAQVTNIIYQDNFARTGVLSGSAPDTVNAPGATWFACDNPALNAVLMTDGSEIACTNMPNPTNGLYLNGFLPFTPKVGHVYTLSCQMVALTGGSQWLAMGFATQPITNNYYAAVNCGSEWLLVRGNGSGIQAFESPGGGSTLSGNATWGTTTNLFTVVLDATTGNANYGWTFRFYTNGVQAATYAPPYNNPPIQYVGIGCDAATGYFQKFTLVDAMQHTNAPIISEQPNNVTNQVGQSATFWVGVTNDYPSASYQWMTNSTGGLTNAIVGATNSTYTTPALNMTYNGLNYSVMVTNVYSVTNSAPAVLTVVTGPPSVYSATKTANTTNIVVAFSKAVDSVTGLNAGNYSLTINGAPSGISVLSASYGSASDDVILTTSTLNTNSGYYLVVQNVKDLYGDAMSGSSTVPVLPAGLVLFMRSDSGVIVDNNGLVDQWLDQTTNGNNASQFFGVLATSHTGPSARPSVDTFNGLAPTLDFGNGTSGNSLHWLQAPASASLASMISNTTMYAVVNFAAVGPANEIMNKTWGNLPAPFDWAPGAGETVQYGNGYNNAPASGTGSTLLINTPSVLTSTITLPVSGGTTNFTFFLNGNTNGSGIVRAVTGSPPGIYDGGRPLWIGGRWDLVNGNMKGQIAEVMLFNTSLSGADRTNVDNYLGQKYFPFTISQNLPATLTSSNGFSVAYSFGASQGSVHGYSFQWQENGTNIPGATGQSYTTAILSSSDNGDTFDVVVALPNGSTTNSITNTLTVLNEPPYVTTAGIPIWNTNELYVIFDEAVNPATATIAANYSLNNGATVNSAVMGDAPNKVILTTSPLTWNANPGYYMLTVQNVQDVYGNTMVTASPSVGLYPPASLWLKAKTGIVTDSGGVNTWNDLSGNGNDLYTVSRTEPQLATNANGYPVIRFNATNATEMDAYSSPTLAITRDMSVGAVMNFATLTGGTNGNTIVSKTGSGIDENVPAPYDYSVLTSGEATFLRGNGTINGSFVATNGPSVSVGAPHILVVSELGNTASHFLDGNLAGTGLLSGNYSETNDADAGNDLTIGVRADGFTRLTGDISEMIVASSALSSNDVVLLNNYFAASYDLPIGTNSYAVITMQPVASTNIDVNATLTVPAAASGNPLTLQWYDTNGMVIAGQTNATLTINNDQTSDAYYLVATNTYDSATSSVVAVTVIGGLNVSVAPTNITLYVGEPATFTALAFGNVPLYYQWLTNGVPVPNATNASYSAVASLGQTVYSCTVTNGYNGYDSTNAAATLTGIAAPTNAFSQTVLSDQPIAYWRLNDPVGSLIAYDYVGGYNGSYGAGTTNGLPGVPLFGNPNELGVAMDNNLITGFVTTPGVNLNTNNVTFVCWANLASSAENNPSGLVFCRTNSTVAGDQIGGANAICYTWSNNPTTYDYNSGVPVPISSWSFLVMAVTPTNATLYAGVSGTLSSAVQSVVEPPQSFTGGLAIGADPQPLTLPARILNGEMDEVAIYNYTLSPSQVAQLYTAALTGVTGSGVNTNPTNIVFSVAGGQLNLSWPADHTGWQLQAQTNNLSVGISTNWVNVNGSTTTNQITIPLSLTNGSVFYRLKY